MLELRSSAFALLGASVVASCVSQTTPEPTNVPEPARAELAVDLAQPSEAPASPPRPTSAPIRSAEAPPLDISSRPQALDAALLGAKHLVVMYHGSMRALAGVTRTKDEARRRCEEALIKIKGGAKFEDVVAQYSDEPNSAARGGDLGNFRPSSMAPEFASAVQALAVGETSGVVETPFGFHVILRTK